MAEAFTFKVRCSGCGHEGRMNCDGFAMRITGGVEVLCPKCNHRTTWVGQFGHDIETEQKRVDVESSPGITGTKEESDDGSGEAGPERADV